MTYELHPLALLAFLSLAVLVVSLPRRQATFPILALVCLMPMGQEFVLANLHFPLFRLMLLMTTVRVLIRHENDALAWTRMDTIFVIWAFVAVPMGALASPSTALLGNRLGDTYNAALMYFVARCVVRDREDVWSGIAQLAWLSLPVAALMLHERLTGHNLLAVLGGVPELTQIREGELRCQGAFRHPLLAGSFGATQFPLFLALLVSGRGRRILATLAMIAATVIVVTASSSGSLLALGCAFLALGSWFLRSRLKGIRWMVIGIVILLAATMNAPVWYLIARMSDLVGGGGWHRAWLIDQAVHHFDEWWLFGTTHTSHWGPSGQVIAEDPNMMDITNHYIMEGVRGGLLRLTLFVTLLALAFQAAGTFLVSHRSEGTRQNFVVWALGGSLFAHCVTFLSVNYFDQSILVLFWLLGTLASIGQPIGRPVLQAPPMHRHYAFEVKT